MSQQFYSIWQDAWNGLLLAQQFRGLLCFAKNDSITLQNIIQLEQPLEHFNLPPTVGAARRTL